MNGSDVTVLGMAPEDRKALGGIIVGTAWGAVTMAGPLAFPNAPRWGWQVSFAISGIIVLAGFAVLAYDFFFRPKGKRLDPFIATAIIAMIVALISLGIFLARDPERSSISSVTGPGASADPEIMLLAPEPRHEIAWQPNKQLAIVYGTEGQLRDDQWWTPIFRVKTANGAVAQDAIVTWQIELTGIEQLVKSSSRLSRFTFDFSTKGRVTISGGGLPSFTYNDLKASQGVPITFITQNGSDAFIPSNVFANILLYVLALMPDQPGARIDPFTFSVSVSWNIPKPGSQRFLVRTNIVNAKPPNITAPEIDALLTFEIAKVQ